MRPVATFVVVIGAVGWLTMACGTESGGFGTTNDTPVTADRSFVADGAIKMELGGGAYEIRTSADTRVHVATSGHTGDAKVDIATDDKTATVKVSNTPKSNFHATIDIPKTSNATIHLAAGEITVEPIGGNLDVDSTAGNVTILVDDPSNYSSVTASVKAGDLKAEPFGESKSGLMQSFTWSGSGKRTLHASLGAGNLKIEQ